MKGKSILAILPILIVSLAACENDTTPEVPTKPEEDTTVNTTYTTADAINYVKSRSTKNAVSSWTGLYTKWDIYDNLYDLNMNSYENGYYDSVENDELFVATNDGVLTSLDSIVYTSEYSGGTSTWKEYYDGTTVYENTDGEITSSSALRTMSYYTQDLIDFIEEEDDYNYSYGIIPWIEEDYEWPYYDWGYGSYETASVEGSIATAESGNTYVTLTDSYYEYESGYYWYYYSYIWEYDLKAEFVYDSANQLVSFTCSYEETYTLPSYGYIETYKQYVTYLPYEGTVEAPSWVK